MPPLAKNRVDTAGVGLIRDWILGLPSDSFVVGTGLEGKYYKNDDFTNPSAPSVGDDGTDEDDNDDISNPSAPEGATPTDDRAGDDGVDDDEGTPSNEDSPTNNSVDAPAQLDAEESPSNEQVDIDRSGISDGGVEIPLPPPSLIGPPSGGLDLSTPSNDQSQSEGSDDVP